MKSGLTARFKMMWVVLKAIGNHARIDGAGEIEEDDE
jgi:hypothetical protein